MLKQPSLGSVYRCVKMLTYAFMRPNGRGLQVSPKRDNARNFKYYLLDLPRLAYVNVFSLFLPDCAPLPSCSMIFEKTGF